MPARVALALGVLLLLVGADIDRSLLMSSSVLLAVGFVVGRY